MQNSPWIVSRPNRNARLRLFCFPFAGGAATQFASWQAELGDEIQVCAIQPRGRGGRFQETPLTEWTSLINELLKVLSENDDVPYAFFGHSLGGLMAFELARACAASHLPSPRHLFISATNAPRIALDRPDITRMDDSALKARLRDYNGTPGEVLNNHELMDLLLPVIRADLTLLQNYRYHPQERLQIPLSIMVGNKDPHIDYQAFGTWREETTGPFSHHTFTGDHFYIQSERDRVLQKVRAALSYEF